METITFHVSDYPDGCRCSACNVEFEDGQEIALRDIDAIGQIPCVTPVCVGCAEEPLPQFEGRLTLRADGTVDTHI